MIRFVSRLHSTLFNVTISAMISISLFGLKTIFGPFPLIRRTFISPWNEFRLPPYCAVSGGNDGTFRQECPHVIDQKATYYHHAPVAQLGDRWRCVGTIGCNLSPTTRKHFYHKMLLHAGQNQGDETNDLFTLFLIW